MLPLIRVNNARCRIASQKILDIPEFSLSTGQHYCVFGGNGAGKSLLSSLLQARLIQGAAAVQYQTGFSPQHDILEVSFEEQQKLWAIDTRHDISEFSDAAQDQGTSVRQLVLGANQADARYDEIMRLLALD